MRFYKILIINKENLPRTLIITSLILIILNFIFNSDKMGFGFWMQIMSSGLLILGMFLRILDRKRQNKNNTE